MSDAGERGREHFPATWTRFEDDNTGQPTVRADAAQVESALEPSDVLRITEAYVYAAGGDLEEALKLAAQDVATLNARAAALGRSVSWGFARRRPPAGLFGGNDPAA